MSHPLRPIATSFCTLVLCALVHAQGAARLDATNRDYTQTHLEIHVRPEIAAGAVEGRVHVHFKSLVSKLETLRLHCMDTRVKVVRDGAGEALGHTLRGGILSIPLAEPVEKGKEGVVVVEYRSTPSRGLYFHAPTKVDPSIPLQLYSQGQSNDNRYWIPCYDQPDDRCTWEVHVTVPSDLKTVSNGVLAGSRKTKGGLRTDHWSFDTRSPTYLISLIVGRFDTVVEQWEDVTLEYNGPVGSMDRLRFSLRETPKMMKFFTGYLDEKYPWKRYAQTFVWDFIYGGMENTTATTLNLRALHRPEQRPNYSAEGLVAHELAHMWFGDLLTCRTWEHIWLNEGFATYMTDLWHEDEYGREEFLLRRRRQNRRYMSGTPKPSRLGLQRKPRGDQPLELFGGKQYSRGAAILHMLRLEVGDDLFQKAVRSYVKRFRDSAVTSEGFRRVVEDVCGRDLEWFWNQWVYGAGYPAFRVRIDRQHRRLVVNQIQGRLGGQGLFRIKVPVRWGPKGETRSLRLYRERHVFRIPKHGGEEDRLPFLRFGVGGDHLMRVELDQPFEAWEAALGSDPDGIGRMDAAEALEEFGGDAVKALAGALERDPLWAVRKTCAEVLGRMDDPEATAPLLKAVEDPDGRVREAVMAALGKKGRAVAAEPALKTAQNEKNPYVKAEALRTLGRVKAKGAFETLRGMLQAEADFGPVRAGALDGLRFLGDPRGAAVAVQYLDYKWGEGSNHNVRKAALDCMTALKPDDWEVHGHLERRLSDHYHRMRVWAAQACGKYGVRRALPRLRQLSQKDAFGQVRNAAKKAVGRLEPPKKKKKAS